MVALATEPFPGIGTLVNTITVLVGAGIGIAVGHKLSQRVRDHVTDALGLVTLLIGFTSAFDVTAPQLREALGRGTPMLIVLMSMLLGGIAGSLLRLEHRLESLGGWLETRLAGKATRSAATRAQAPAATAAGGAGSADPAMTAADGDPVEAAEHLTAHPGRARFIEGFVTASLVFCVGPLTILGAISDGLGRGADQLFLKSVLDGFAGIAFAASFGWGVAASAIVVLVVQGFLTGVGALLGEVMNDVQITALAATGGVILVGLGLRLLKIKQVAVADFLPALVVAPLLAALVQAIR